MKQIGDGEKVQMRTRKDLAEEAHRAALKPFHGDIQGEESNLEPIISLFPKWSVQQADGLWCAAFVYYCCLLEGFDFPYSPSSCVSCSLAGCGGWEEFAMGDSQIGYHRREERGFVPQAGDIVLYDRVFNGQEHDHIGVVLEASDSGLVAAEGNVPGKNCSGLVRRRRDEHIRAYIRIPDGYRYEEDSET